MADPAHPTLQGYRYSVYNRIARVVLHEKSVSYETAEVNPFEPDNDNKHPFGRVPVLIHQGFRIYETRAITRYVDAAFDGPSLMPSDPKAIARVEQCLSVIDNYAYWPLVRQVFAHAVFRPMEGERPIQSEIANGLASAAPVLQELDAICAEGIILNADQITRADCHLAPMIDYFSQAAEGAAALSRYPNLSNWFQRIQSRPSLKDTRPILPNP